jgi:hypothetical protein
LPLLNEEAREATALILELIVLKSLGTRAADDLQARLRLADAYSTYRSHRERVAALIREQARSLVSRGVREWEVIDQFHDNIRAALAPEDRSSEPALEILGDITLWVLETLAEQITPRARAHGP